MGVTETNLDDYLSTPDCPQCGSEDVICTETRSNGHGGYIKVWYCEKCGHTWATES